MRIFSLGRMTLALFLFTSFSSAWPWPPSIQNVEGRIHRRADPESDTSAAETGKSQPAKTGGAAKTAARTAAASGTAAASSQGAAKTKSGATKAAKTGAAKTKAAATKTQSVDPRLPPGGVNMITPSALAQTSYYKVGDHVTFAWNYTSLSVKPSKIDVYVTCTTNSATYTISNNATFEPTGNLVWDTKPEASGTAPLLVGTYTLVIHDASKDITAIPQAGHLGAYDQFTFGMYTPQPYTPLSEGWKCATCSGAMSSMDLHALKSMLGMCIITTLSFTWFAGGFESHGHPPNTNRFVAQSKPHAHTNTNRLQTHTTIMPAITVSAPSGWTPAMKAFLKRAFANGEDTKSAIILLETEFPHMVGKVSAGWAERVKRGEA
ncbi:MAG: hypothetical protein LQ338_000757 [Usnochroma carphineum]|nr:MAG: hypothetical protein LQ338_000757 [Usnochroma carphineum]